MSEATVANCAPPLRWICDPARRAQLISGPYWGISAHAKTTKRGTAMLK
jgi:hypothetical protein